MVVALGGLSGSGKSTLARELAAAIGQSRPAVWINTDIVRKELWGVRLDEVLPKEAYERAFSQKTFMEFNRRVMEAVAGGRVVVADAVFATAFGRTAFEREVRDSGSGFAGLWLDVPPDILRRRVAARRNDVSDADEAVLNLQLTFNLGPIAWRKIDASREPAAVLAQALDVLNEDGVIPAPALHAYPVGRGKVPKA